MENPLGLNGIDFSPEINMVRYLQKIRQYPILSQDDEYQMAVEYQKTRNPELAKILVTSHLRLVVKVVSKYRGYGLPTSEMISEGNIGLLYAIDKFEPEKGFRFSTYALWWIKASVQKYILNSWSRLFCIVSLVRVEVKGREKLDRSTSYVFVANHQGAYDIFLVYGYLGHKFKWMMIITLRRIPFVGAACAAAGFIFVDRSGKGLRETLAAAEKILTRGMSLVVFPEGSRTPDGQLHRFKKGAYQIADDLSLPVVPMTIDGSYRVLPKSSKIIRPGKITLTIHEPVYPGADGHYDMDALIDTTYRAIESALPQQGPIANKS